MLAAHGVGERIDAVERGLYVGVLVLQDRIDCGIDNAVANLSRTQQAAFVRQHDQLLQMVDFQSRIGIKQPTTVDAIKKSVRKFTVNMKCFLVHMGVSTHHKSLLRYNPVFNQADRKLPRANTAAVGGRAARVTHRNLLTLSGTRTR